MIKAKDWILFDNPHTSAGTFCILGVLMATVFGMVTYKVKNTAIWNSQLIKIFRFIHRTFAYLLLATTYVTTALGVLYFANAYSQFAKLNYLGFLNIGLCIIIVLFFELRHQAMLKKEDGFNVPIDTPTISEADFKRRIREG